MKKFDDEDEDDDEVILEDLEIISSGAEDDNIKFITQDFLSSDENRA